MMENKLIFTPAFTTDLSDAFEYINRCYTEPWYSAFKIEQIIQDILRLKTCIEDNSFCPFPLDMLYKCIVDDDVAIVYLADVPAQKVYLMRCFFRGNAYRLFFEHNFDSF